MKSCIVWALLGVVMTGTCAGGAEVRPDLVARVKAGELREARASWWGFDREDATACLQAALDSRVPRLVVDRMDGPWIVRPLRGISNQELFFEPGAEVLAKRGAFRAKSDWLLTYRNCTNVTLRGYRATLRMWHADYLKPTYEKSEWRHALALLSCRNVRIEGLSFVGSGGDGIYLGTTGGALDKCQDVVIRDVLCHDNHRQGISVISAENLLIENTVLRETHGTPPAAGIDFEPNRPGEVLRNCVMRNCLTVNNEGRGYELYLGQLTATSAPLDVRFENCTSLGDRNAFTLAGLAVRGRTVGGTVAIRGCSFEKPRTSLAVQLQEGRFTDLKYVLDASRIVQTNAAGAEVVTPLDAAWQRAHLPAQHDPDFGLPQIAHPDFARAEVHDAAPGVAAPLQPLRIRSRGVYAVYADRARPLAFTGRQIRVGRQAAATNRIEVTDAAGRVVAQLPLPGFETAVFSFDAPAAGFYRMAFKLRWGAFELATADAPVALDVTEAAQPLLACTGRLGLVVPRGTDAFALFVRGEGEEKVCAALADPRGRRVWEQDDIAAWAKAVRRGNPPDGLWTITLARPAHGLLEDYQIDVAGVPGFLFLSPDRHWTLSSPKTGR